jgi:hypothetical protein
MDVLWVQEEPLLSLWVNGPMFPKQKICRLIHDKNYDEALETARKMVRD